MVEAVPIARMTNAGPAGASPEVGAGVSRTRRVDRGSNSGQKKPWSRTREVGKKVLLRSGSALGLPGETTQTLENSDVRYRVPIEGFCRLSLQAMCHAQL